MIKKRFCATCVGLIGLGVIGTANASIIVEYNTPTAPNSVEVGAPSSDWTVPEGNNYNYGSGTDSGDAVGYGSATNTKGKWQGLGTVNGIDDGLLWSVGDSAFGTDADLIIGQNVTFKFLFWQANNGAHSYDQIFAAFDFGQDKSFDTSDTVLYGKVYTTNQYSGGPAKDTTVDNYRYLEFELTILVPESMQVGETWLRARTHCWHTTFPNVSAYGELAQGETEDYRFNIVNEVPEPTSLLLFGAGLAGLAGFRARRKK